MFMIVNTEMTSNWNSRKNDTRSAGLDRADEQFEFTSIACGVASALREIA